MAKVQAFTIYTSGQLAAVQGVNYGDLLSHKTDLYLEDIHRLKAKAQPTRLTLQADASGQRLRVAPHSAIGAIARQSTWTVKSPSCPMSGRPSAL